MSMPVILVLWEMYLGKEKIYICYEIIDITDKGKYIFTLQRQLYYSN